MNKKISIVLAIYKPNIVWLNQLLVSLNNQTYTNIELLVCDDCPQTPIDESLFHSCITNFPFKIYKNNENLGSNKTFEYLTSLSTGSYIAYCDQDDIWENDKLEILVQKLEETNSLLAYSDLSIIDAQGIKTANSITEIRTRNIFYNGKNLAHKLLIKNFVTGCTMIIKNEIAKAAIPFPELMIHDHWLALYASSLGELYFVNQPLVQYRQHNNNQTSVLMNVKTKNDYLNERIVLPQQNFHFIKPKFSENINICQDIDFLINWYDLRRNWWEKFNLVSMFKLIKFGKINPHTSMFEIITARLPEPLFCFLVKQIQQGKL